MEHIYDMVIIGGGPAGYTAALYSSRAGFDTVILERMSVGGQMTLTDVIDNYPGFPEGIDGFTLSQNMQQGAQHFGAKTMYDEVVSVDLSGEVKEIETAFSGKLYAKTVVIASGANPRELGLENEQELIGQGVHYCAHCDGRFYKDKVALVVGGGNSAVSDALYLSHLCKKVILVHRRDTLRATKVYHEPLKNAKNIEFYYNSVLSKVNTENSKVVSASLIDVKTNMKSEVECDGVFISIGRKPATEFLQNQLELDKGGYIVADESTKTSIDGVFAVGDVRTKVLRQVVTAVADGAVAVHYAEEFLA
ncbi:MAG: thioredoxin-disulfide reductase [Ruminococcaceae bacterium]|nr:thioredoxin-disulfide reductase [Oscillospiraceae bacterium]